MNTVHLYVWTCSRHFSFSCGHVHVLFWSVHQRLEHHSYLPTLTTQTLNLQGLDSNCLLMTAFSKSPVWMWQAKHALFTPLTHYQAHRCMKSLFSLFTRIRFSLNFFITTRWWKAQMSYGHCRKFDTHGAKGLEHQTWSWCKFVPVVSLRGWLCPVIGCALTFTCNNFALLAFHKQIHPSKVGRHC